MSGILDKIRSKEEWEHFLTDKIENSHIRLKEQEQIREFIDCGVYLQMADLIEQNVFPNEYPRKQIVNKEGTSHKKRIVYTFSENVNITLKFIACHLYRYDTVFYPDCYSFRRGYGVKNALNRIAGHQKLLSVSYGLKLDIKNYFNSIEEEKLVEKLSFLKEDDKTLYDVFCRILMEKRVWDRDCLVEEKHGAMAGIPVSPFFANVYLTEVDRDFWEKGILYFRYSDDILLFASEKEELMQWQDQLYQKLAGLGLLINHDKEKLYQPGEQLEFLGFSYQQGIFDLSDNTKRKTRAKMKRKADALRRWQRKKGLTPDKAAIGFIHAMNRKFFGEEKEDEFTWCRWFFPNINTTEGLHQIDCYMQEMIRYSVTGRHYKGNYRIRYEQLKQWGYRSLVHEYYSYRKQVIKDRENSYT